MVKWLRWCPFTASARVRIPIASPMSFQRLCAPNKPSPLWQNNIYNSISE
nr:MAG TPA: hypothetical protein [Caudoviricetes sp.]